MPLDRFEQTRVLQRDRRLIGERRDERDLRIAERSRVAPHQDDDADQILGLDGHSEEGSVARRPRIDVLAVSEDVRDVNRLARDSRAAGSRRSVESVWMIPVVLGALRLAAIRRDV